jgi:hypothetical protein
LPSCSAWCAVLPSWFTQAKSCHPLKAQSLSPRIWICSLHSALNQLAGPSFPQRNSLMMCSWKRKANRHFSHNRWTLMWWCWKKNKKGSSPWPKWCWADNTPIWLIWSYPLPVSSCGWPQTTTNWRCSSRDNPLNQQS